MTFSAEQLNFFKFSIVVLDDFQVGLCQVFLFMWDNQVATSPGVPKWDDSVVVRNELLRREGGVTRVPALNKSYKEWDCTALFRATLFAQTFAVPDGSGGVSTLHSLYVRPCGIPAGTFHHSVLSPTGNQAETYALALDQLRLLRNTLCHQISTQKIDKATFDNYIKLAKDAFIALGQNTTKIDEIGKLGEDDFPTTRLQQLEDELKKEKDAAIKFKQIDDHLTKIESQVDDVGSDMKNVKTKVKDVKTQVEDIASDMKNVNGELTDLKTQMQDIGSEVKEAKTELTDVKTQVKEVGSDVKELNARIYDIKEAMQAGSSEGLLFADSCMPDKIPYFVGRQEEYGVVLNHLTNGDTRLVGEPYFFSHQEECGAALNHLPNGDTGIWDPPELLEELKVSPLVEVLDDESSLDDAGLNIIKRFFKRLTGQERDRLFPWIVFPSFFRVQEANAVLGSKLAPKSHL